jgi:hypothetical protein
MVEIHDRMPAILPLADYNLWLDPEFEGKERLLSLLRPYPPAILLVTTCRHKPRSGIQFGVAPGDAHRFAPPAIIGPAVSPSAEGRRERGHSDTVSNRVRPVRRQGSLASCAADYIQDTPA